MFTQDIHICHIEMDEKLSRYLAALKGLCLLADIHHQECSILNLNYAAPHLLT